MASKMKRKGKGQKFVMIHRWMTDSPAYRSLSSVARAALIEFGLAYDGTNNGYIAMAVRTLGDRLDVGRNVAQRAISELEDRGFLRCTEDSAFTRKNRIARQWRLTEHPCDRTNQPATKDFMKWRLENLKHSPASVTDSPASVTAPAKNRPKSASQSHQRDCQRSNDPSHSPASVTLIDIPQEVAS